MKKSKCPFSNLVLNIMLDALDLDINNKRKNNLYITRRRVINPIVY